MNLLGELIISFIFSLVSSIIGTKVLITVLANFKIIDVPGNRRAHLKITPRGGGIALVLIFIFMMISWQCIASVSISHLKLFILTFSLIALVSLIDDLKTINIGARFIVHLASASFALWLYLIPNPLFHNFLPSLVDYVLAAISFTAFLNIYNFMDGIDGITPSQSIHLSITMLLICFFSKESIIYINLIQIVTTIILGWAVGFLFFNWQPASIFIGDVGSISLGFLLGICAILIAASGPKHFVASFIMCLYYISDGGLTILIRLFKREKIWQPHLQHFFQKAVKKGMSHKQVVTRIIICNIFLMVLSLNSLRFCSISFILAILTVTITLYNFVK